MTETASVHHARTQLEHDEFGRPYIYYATFKDRIGGGGFAVFSRLEPAIFYVVTGLGNDVDWSTFPDETGEYPNEERRGDRNLSPTFVVERECGGKKISGHVYRMAAMLDWIVGNGIAEASKQWYLLATGKDDVFLKGEGNKLSAEIT